MGTDVYTMTEIQHSSSKLISSNNRNVSEQRTRILPNASGGEKKTHNVTIFQVVPGVESLKLKPPDARERLERNTASKYTLGQQEPSICTPQFVLSTERHSKIRQAPKRQAHTPTS